MKNHVDVYVNDWAAGHQRLVARVSLNADQKLEIEVVEEKYRSVVLRPIYDEAGRKIDPVADPVEFFKQLPTALTGSYLGASPAHNGSCPFPASNLIDLEPVHNQLIT